MWSTGPPRQLLPRGLRQILANVRQDFALTNIRQDFALVNIRQDFALVNIRQDFALVNIRQDFALTNIRQDFALVNIRQDFALTNIRQDFALTNIRQDFGCCLQSKSSTRSCAKSGLEVSFAIVDERGCHQSGVDKSVAEDADQPRP